jgi:hypothetical protein
MEDLIERINSLKERKENDNYQLRKPLDNYVIKYKYK